LFSFDAHDDKARYSTMQGGICQEETHGSFDASPLQEQIGAHIEAPSQLLPGATETAYGK